MPVRATQGKYVQLAANDWAMSAHYLELGAGTNYVLFLQTAGRRAGRAPRLCNLPAEMYNGGTSEARNWIATAGAMSGTGLHVQLLDYVPCYRSEAGTGNAMGFAQWL